MGGEQKCKTTNNYKHEPSQNSCTEHIGFGRPKAALLFWFLMVVLLSICLLSASIVATCIAAHFALCRAL